MIGVPSGFTKFLRISAAPIFTSYDRFEIGLKLDKKRFIIGLKENKKDKKIQ
jgi:hypothetical protein